MKKAALVLVLIMAVLAANAQATKTPATKEKAVRTAVKAGDLQKAITDNIAKDYPGYTIKEATCVTKGDKVTYDVVIEKGNTTETLCYNKEGAFLQKLPPPPKKK
jgi:hypothetical protein